MVDRQGLSLVSRVFFYQFLEFHCLPHHALYIVRNRKSLIGIIIKRDVKEFGLLPTVSLKGASVSGPPPLDRVVAWSIMVQ